MTVHVSVLEQVVDAAYRLSRHVCHDDASRNWDAKHLIDEARPLQTTLWESVTPPWDQGQIGDCTANAAYGALMTKPYWRNNWNFAEPDCVKLYELETRLDDKQIPGQYPAQDTGSTGLWSMKALRSVGLITGYSHAFSLRTVLRLITQVGPVSTGISWYQSMFSVDANNTIVYDTASGVAGGHQLLIVGWDHDRQLLRLRNSWGTGWADGGYAWLKLADYDDLLHQQGDAVVPRFA